MMTISLLDGIGILLLIPLLSISGIASLESSNPFFTKVFSFIDAIPKETALPTILIIFVFIVIGQNIIQRSITIQNSKIQNGFFRHLRIETYQALLNANWEFFIKHRKSDLVNLLTSEIAKSSAGIYSFLQFLASLAFTFIQICFAFYLSPNITIFVLLCGVILLLFNRNFLKRSFSLGNKNYTLGKEYLAGVTDQINGIKDIKSNSLEQTRMQWFRQVTKGMLNEQIEYSQLKTTSQMYYKIASAVFIALFIYVAINMFQAQGGQLMLVIIIFSRLWPRVSGIQGSLEKIATTLPSYKAVKAFQEECNYAKEVNQEHNNILEKPLRIASQIECKEIFFRYNKNEGVKYALKNINILIPANKMTAVVGKSGAGKSTLIDILMGLNQPEKGEVLLDGKALTGENLYSLRKAISYVPQDPFLFNTSIRENFTIVSPDTTEERIWEALEFASAADFVKKLPKGLDTIIGDRGIRLSGGERQRIVLARAILREPSIIVLDEATSALDTENELKIQQAIENLKGKMTIIVIAHRLSTIHNADKVVVLDNGTVIQEGEFGQLSKDSRGVFGQLIRNQLEVSL